MGSRFLEVEPERLPGWVERYLAARGDAVRTETTATGLRLVGDDGSLAQLDLLVPTPRWPADGVERLPAVPAAGVLARLADDPGALAVVLVRRGGWAVGVVRGGELVAGAAGRRYVQGRTAAGGWSQQRYARRRASQAGKLADGARGGLDRVRAELATDDHPRAVVTGGDRALAADVLGEDPWSGLPRAGPLAVGDPRRADLDQAARRVRSLRVTVHDAP